MAYANGIAQVGAELTSAQRAMTLTLMVEQQLGKANGALAREFDSPAGRARRLSVALAELRNSLGNVVMPIWNAVIPGLIKLANALTVIFNKIASVVNGILSLFGLGVKSGGSGGFLSEVADTAEDIGSSLSDGLGGMSSGAEKVKDSLGKGAKAASDIVKATKELMGIDELNLLDNPNSGSDSGSGGGSGSGSGGNGGSGGLGGGLGDLSTGLESGKSAIESIARELSNWEKAFLDVFQHIKMGFMAFKDDIIKQWSQLKYHVEQLAQTMTDFIVSCWENGGDRIAIRIGGLIGAIVKTAIQIADSVVQVINNLFEHLNPDGNENTQKFIDALDNLLLQVVRFVDDCGEWFAQFATACQPFINNLGDIAMIVGTILMQVLGDAVKVISDFMNSFVGQALIEGVCKVLEWFSQLIEDCLGFIRDNLDVFEALALGIGGIVGAIKLINKAMEIWNGIMLIWNGISVITASLAGALGGAIAFITSPIGLVVLAIGGLIAVGVLLYKNWDTIKAKCKEVWEAVVNWFNEAGIDIEGILGDMWESISGTFQNIWDTISTIMKAVWDVIKTVWTSIFNTVKDVVMNIWEVIKSVFNLISSFIQLVLSIIVGIFTGEWDACYNMTSKFLLAILDVIEDTFNLIWDFIVDVFVGIKDTFTSAWNGMMDILTDTLENMYNGIKDKFDSVIDFLVGIVDKIKGIFNFEWEIPKPKLPKINWSMKDTGFMGLKIPDFSISWNAKGKQKLPL